MFLSTDKLEQWIKMLSVDTRKLYYTAHALPELQKSIEAICIHRASTKNSQNQDLNEKTPFTRYWWLWIYWK